MNSPNGRRLKTPPPLNWPARAALMANKMANKVGWKDSGRIVRRAPKLTVTREWSSLRQKGCYPMGALFFRFSVFSVGSSLWVGSRDKTSRGAAGEPPARAPLRSNNPGSKWGVWGRVIHSFQGRAWRRAAIVFKLRSTCRFRAKGLSWDFSCSNRSLVCGVTSGLANTRAKGVWAAP